MSRLALALTLLAGCGRPVPVFWIDTRPEPSFDRIEEACAWWGLDCFETDDDDGALTIILTDECNLGDETLEEVRCGETLSKDPCGPAFWVFDGPGFVEHEIGHAFRLTHRDDFDNIMHKFFPSPDKDATAWQDHRVSAGASFLANCIGP